MFLIIFTAICGGYLLAQESLNITPFNNKTINLKTGNMHVFSYKITNNYTQKQQFKVSVLANNKWQLLPQPKTMVLMPKTDTIYSFNCFASKNARAGLDQLIIKVEPNDSNLKAVTYEEQLTIGGYSKITANTNNAPVLLNYNETHEFELLVKNQGNKVDTVIIKTIKCKTTSPKKFFIQPDESITIPLSVVNNVNCQEVYACKDYYTITLYNNQDSIILNITNLYDALPSPDKKKTDQKLFPLSFLGGTIIDNRSGSYTNGIFYNLNGHGTLDTENKHNIAFGLKGPDRSALSVYGQREELFVSYNAKDRYYFVGDKSYTVSTLTEFSRYARGFEIREQNKYLNFGVIYLTPRFVSEFKNQVAGYISKEFFNNTEVKLIGFRKEEYLRDSSILLSNIGSININTRFDDNNSVRFEYALSKNVNGFSNALELNLKNRIKKLSIFSQSIYSDKYFPGLYRNTYFTNTYVGYTFNQRFSMSVNGFYNQVNFAGDTTIGIKPLSRYINLNLNRTFFKRLSTILSVETRSNKDLMPQLQFNYTDNLLRFRLNYRSLDNRTILGNFTEIGVTRDFILYPSISQRGFIRTGLEATRMVWQGAINSNVNYQYSQIAANMQLSHLYLGAGISQNFFGKYRVNLQYNNAYRVETNNFDRALINLQLSYMPNISHEFNFTGFKTLYYGEVNTVQNTFMVSYKLNVDVPLTFGDKTFKISGIIKDSTAKKLSRIPVFLNGKSTLTDDLGRFTFNNLGAGTYYLNIDDKSLGFKKVASVTMPMLIVVDEKEKERFVEISYVKSASINVVVNYIDNQESMPGMIADKDKPPSDFVIEISQNEFVVRKNCAIGDNLFSGLYPGNWNVKVYEGTLPKNVKLDKNNFTIETMPAEDVIIELNLTRKQRMIKFQNLNPIKPK